MAQERILIIEVNWLGDVLFSTPAIRAIRQQYPKGYIAALVVPRGKEVLTGNHYLDEVIVLEEDGVHKGFLGSLRLISELRRRRFSIVYLFHKSLTRAFWAFLSGAKRRVGYNTKKRGCFLTVKPALPAADFHRADIYYYLVRGQRIPEAQRYCDFFVAAADEQFITEFLAKHRLGSGKKIVILHAGGNWPPKLWPQKSFQELIACLGKRYGVEVIISGSQADFARAESVASMAVFKPFNACGLTTIGQLGALFKKSALVVSADSGPLHLAAAAGANTIGLFGPTSAAITGPLGKAGISILRAKDTACIIPCYNLECKDNICMKFLDVGQVIKEIEERRWLSP